VVKAAFMYFQSSRPLTQENYLHSLRTNGVTRAFPHLQWARTLQKLSYGQYEALLKTFSLGSPSQATFQAWSPAIETKSNAKVFYQSNVSWVGC